MVFMLGLGGLIIDIGIHCIEDNLKTARGAFESQETEKLNPFYTPVLDDRQSYSYYGSYYGSPIF